MATKKYDEFSKQTLDKMSQTMSDMTYLYNETEVPKSHYKKILDETIDEDLPEVIQLNILNVYVKTLKDISEENPAMFFKALCCLDRKINPLNMRPKESIALNETWCFFSENRKHFPGYLSTEIHNVFDNSPNELKLDLTQQHFS